jgi:hypothetical protein
MAVFCGSANLFAISKIFELHVCYLTSLDAQAEIYRRLFDLNELTYRVHHQHSARSSTRLSAYNRSAPLLNQCVHAPANPTGCSRIKSAEIYGSIYELAISDARQIRKEGWLHDDLAELKSGGDPLYAAQSKLSVRPATAEEAIVFGRAAELAKPSDDMVLAYLV